jgi:hypothetical protein
MAPSRHDKRKLTMTLTQEQIDAERAVGFRDGAEWADKNLVGPLLARVAELEAENEKLKDQLREPCNDAEFGMKP